MHVLLIFRTVNCILQIYSLCRCFSFTHLRFIYLGFQLFHIDVRAGFIFLRFWRWRFLLWRDERFVSLLHSSDFRFCLFHLRMNWFQRNFQYFHNFQRKNFRIFKSKFGQGVDWLNYPITMKIISTLNKVTIFPWLKSEMQCP